MDEISVIIIDDSEFYRWLLRNFLKGHRIITTGHYTQESFKESTIVPASEIIVISHRENQPEILETILFIKEKYRTAKIIASVSVYDKAEVEAITQENIQGLVFKTEDDPDLIIKAIRAVNNNETYFPHQQD